MKLVYIAGPYRASTPWLEEQNIRAAEALAYDVAKLGVYPVCPHTNTRSWFAPLQPGEFWLEATKELLLRCDACIFTLDWERSDGARRERAACIERGIVFFDSVGALSEWLGGSR